MVEHDLAKVGVASSSLVSRSRFNSETSGNRGFVFCKTRLQSHRDSKRRKTSSGWPGGRVVESDALTRCHERHRVQRRRVSQDGELLLTMDGSSDNLIRMARWQSGHAAACKAVYAGSIPTLASIRRSFQSTRARIAPGRTCCPARARVAKSVDARDLKSLDWKRSCRFESGSGHLLRQYLSCCTPAAPFAHSRDPDRLGKIQTAKNKTGRLGRVGPFWWRWECGFSASPQPSVAVVASLLAVLPRRYSRTAESALT